MEVFGDGAPLRAFLAPRRAKGPVALVPTMGALHEGHASLVRLARARAATVVVSIFVNPLQFAPGEDFGRYPRPFERDRELLLREGVDALFAPDPSAFYPPGFATSVSVTGVSEGQEGAVRPGHFAGVATVVAKLLLCVGPDIAVFGRKDLQQAAVVRRMVRDLDFPVEIAVAPISREEDGLARSSRNAYLSPADRARAALFPSALREAARRIREGVPAAEAETGASRELRRGGFEVDYVETTDPETMGRLDRPRPGAALAAAVRLAGVRLLDNVLIEEA